MKKVKWLFIAMAIVFSIGGAFATRSRIDCTNSPQYYQVGSQYVAAGQSGVDYVCWYDPAASCTWVKIGNNFALCQTGDFQKIPH